MDLKNEIREIQDYPVKGVSFKDITTLIGNQKALNFVIDSVVENFKEKGVTKVVGLEARGFICGGAIAGKLEAGFVPVRKKNKLPAEVISEVYDLEYGTDQVEMHVDAVNEDDVVLVHDDLLATGGSALAALKLLKRRGVKKIYFSFICDLEFINTSNKEEIFKYENHILVRYS
jgi:adenine phosphoribosyltransferase